MKRHINGRRYTHVFVNFRILNIKRRQRNTLESEYKGLGIRIIVSFSPVDEKEVKGQTAF